MIVAVRLLSFFPHMSLPSLLFLMIWLDTQLLKHFAIRNLRISKTRPPKKSTFLHSRRCSSTLQSCYFAILLPNPSHSFLWRLGGQGSIPLALAVFISLYPLFLFSFFSFFIVVNICSRRYSSGARTLSVYNISCEFALE